MAMLVAGIFSATIKSTTKWC